MATDPVKKGNTKARRKKEKLEWGGRREKNRKTEIPVTIANFREIKKGSKYPDRGKKY
jgi:hypothetical protein